MCEQLFNYILINARRLLSLFVRLLSFHLSKEYVDITYYILSILPGDMGSSFFWK